MIPRLLGLAGYARVGKDTIGAILADAHGYERRAFADKLRELAYVCDPILDNDPMHLWRYAEEIDGMGYESAKREFPEVRRFLVALGAGARKVLGGDVWLDACLPNDINVRGDTGQYIGAPRVITDVRYRNEAQRIVDLGGEVWYIFRPGVEAANDEEHRSISDLLSQVPVRVFINDHALVDLPYVVSMFLAHDPD